MKKLVIIILLLVGIGVSNNVYSQTGGKKRERVKTKKRGNSVLTQYKSRGHADEFARGSGRRGLFARLFRKTRPSWKDRSSGSRKSHYKDNQNLFVRNRTKGKMENAAILDKQNSDRAKHRVRGSRAFKSRKYKR